MNKNFLYYFYAPTGRFEACGMFTASHLIAVAICVALIICFALYCIKTNKLQTNIFMRYVAIILTILELIKIAHSFIYKELHLDAWFPLSYCGLFIFAAWMSGFGRKNIKNAGEAYITYGCPIAGIAFLIFPTTSLMSFPVWHFFSLYSLFFHSVMIFSGIIMLYKEKRLNKESFLNYTYFVIGFSIPAIIINSIKGSNLMNLRMPYNIPIDFLQQLYDFTPAAYTVLVLICYTIIPFAVGGICGKIKRK